MNTLTDIPVTRDRAVDLERHGITRIATERFEVGGYRYEKLSDAMAEARRRIALRPAR